MKNGDPRSAAWIKDALRNWRRDDLAVQTALCLVSVDPIPSIDEIRTWTDEQCLVAEDWAWAVHFKASDNNNRVPAVPEHLKPYQRKYPQRTPAQAAKDAVQDMRDDNGYSFKPTAAQWTHLESGIARMQKAGCFFTDAEISLFGSGEHGEMLAHFQRFDGFDEAQKTMIDIFEEQGQP